MYTGHDSGREDIPSCLEGTRVAILEDILSWSSANGERSPVYWLSRLAGVGKSSIAKTVANRARERGTLGAIIFFSRSGEPLRDPDLVFPTLVSQLAQSDDVFKNVIEEALRYSGTDGYRELRTQLDNWILDPLLKINRVRRPVLIILDALENGAAEILRLVFSRMIRIPFLRILITSRPRSSLSSMFNQVPNLEKTILDHVKAFVIQQDICFYISTELAKIPQTLHFRMPPDWATETQQKSLVEKSGKLFAYAPSTIQFIADPRVQDPRRHLSLILHAQSAREAGVTPYSLLDDLYMRVVHDFLTCIKVVIEAFSSGFKSSSGVSYCYARPSHCIPWLNLFSTKVMSLRLLCALFTPSLSSPPILTTCLVFIILPFSNLLPMLRDVIWRRT
jgi:hypothetical protein